MNKYDPANEYECQNCGDWIYWSERYQQWEHGEWGLLACIADTKAEPWPDMRLFPDVVEADSDSSIESEKDGLTFKKETKGAS